MYVFQAIRICGFWKAHNTLFDSKRLAKEPRQLLTISTQFFMYMYVAVLLVFDRISYRPGEGRMRLNVVSTKLISTKRRPLDVIENSLMLLAVSLPHRRLNVLRNVEADCFIMLNPKTCIHLWVGIVVA